MGFGVVDILPSDFSLAYQSYGAGHRRAACRVVSRFSLRHGSTRPAGPVRTPQDRKQAGRHDDITIHPRYLQLVNAPLGSIGRRNRRLSTPVEEMVGWQ